MDAAIACNSWNWAIQLLNSFPEEENRSYCLKIAKKLAWNNQLNLAEKYFI